MAITLVALKLPAVQFLTNFNCFLVLTFELKILLGSLNPFCKKLLKRSKNLQKFFDIQHVIEI